MKEYNENKWSRYFIVVLLFLMGLITILSTILSIWNLESNFIVLIIIGFGMVVSALYTLVNSSIHKIYLTDDFIIEKTLLQNKKLYFNEITHLHIQSLFTEIIANKKKITIGNLRMQKADEIIGFVVSKIKDNQILLFAGDPILFQAYINGSSEDELLNEFNEQNLTEFTFVETAELVKKQWLFREVNLKTSKGSFKITYFGKGMGYECVFVNEELVSKKDSAFWYVPNFNFNYQDINFSVNVRVYPWLTIRKFWIEVNNITVYSE